MEEYMPAIRVVIEVVAVMAVTVVLSKIADAIYKRLSSKRDAPLFWSFVHNFTKFAIYALGILHAASSIPQLSGFAATLLTGSGIAAVALSLSAQESLSNLVSGLFITIFKPFEVGNRVTLINTGVTGYVESITLRHTIIKTLTNTRVVVPNSKMNTEVIENTELVDRTASYFLDVPVAYESNVAKVRSILTDVVYNHPLYLKENPIVIQLRAFEASGLAFRVKVWTRTIDENFEACSDIRITLLERFAKEGIEIPYNKVVVYQHGVTPEESKV